VKTFYLYILLCSDNTYYTGVTSNLDQRIQQHSSKFFKDSYTSSRLPVELVWYTEFSDPYSAFDWKKRIKGWSQKKKLAVIEGRYNDLIELSKKNFNPNNESQSQFD
jgi:putative endonuclease